jgi:hypothetical protein
LIGLLALPLAACETAKERLGLERRTPDPFAVMTRAPLAMPPEFALRAPTPGAPRPQEITPAAQAAGVLLGGKPVAADASRAEKALLEKTGATATDPSIRATVNAETADIIREDTPTIQKLIGNDDPRKAPAPVINAAEEKARLDAARSQVSPTDKKKSD